MALPTLTRLQLITNNSQLFSLEIFFGISLFPAEASCASVIRSAKGFVEDVGESIASKSVGLVDLARRSEHNAERDCHKLLVGKYELALPIPITQVSTDENGGHVPVLRLRDWMEFIVSSNHTHMLCGLPKPDWPREKAILGAFWSNWKAQCPLHPIFEKAQLGELALETTFPLILHGDEGRGRKRSAFLVMNFHSVLGGGVKEKSKARKSSYVQMLPNYHGRTTTSRLMMVGLPKHLYTGKNEHVWDCLMQVAAEESEHMFTHGIKCPFGRGKFTAAVLYVSGDWPWLADSGYFQRSYRNVQKHKTRKKDPVGVCHQCRAGQVGFDFEEINTLQPKWLATMFSQSLCEEDGYPSPLEAIVHVPGQLAALWSFDIFHTVHLGISRCFLGSYLALLSGLQPQGSVDDRFEAVSGVFLGWCKQRKRRAHITRLNKELIQWQSTGSYPSGGWHKGALSTVLMEWAEDLFKKDGSGWPPMLQFAGKAAVSLNAFMRLLYREDAWLSPDTSRIAANHAMGFLKTYSRLARMSLENNQNLWILQPKLHSFHHLAVALWESSWRGATLNPICYATQADEDFIGRPSRLARRVTSQQPCADRVLQRYLQQCHSSWVKAGLIVTAKAMAKSGTVQ